MKAEVRIKKWLALVALASSFCLHPSALAAATPTPTPTPLPTATPASVGQNFNVAWTDDNPAGTVDGYRLKYGSAAGTYTTTVDVKAPAKTKDFVGMPLGTIYLVATAYNAAGESKPTPEVRINILPVPNAPGAPTITNRAGDGLVNVSSRAAVAPGEDALIGGFIVGGGAEKVAVRAIGPSLGALGVETPLSKATIELHDATGAIVRSNDGWMNGPDAEELRTLKLAPGSVNESALIASLEAGAYTAVVRGGASESGIGLVEVYAIR